MHDTIETLKAAVEQQQASSTQIREIIQLLDAGSLRIALNEEGGWQVQEWVKKAVLQFFPLCKVEEYSDSAPFYFRDGIPLKKEFSNIRIVPGGSSVRYGAYLAPSVVMMPPSYVNIGVFVDEGTMIDSHVLVGSCAQIGKGVHLSAGVQIGGVLEPLQASPVIVEDHAFIGAGSIVVEGVLVRRSAVLAPGVVLSGSTPIVELNEKHEKVAEYKGEVPENAIVIPGIRMKGDSGYGYQTPLIIGYKSEGTSAKVALNTLLRDF